MFSPIRSPSPSSWMKLLCGGDISDDEFSNAGKTCAEEEVSPSNPQSVLRLEDALFPEDYEFSAFEGEDSTLNSSTSLSCSEDVLPPMDLGKIWVRCREGSRELSPKVQQISKVALRVLHNVLREFFLLDQQSSEQKIVDSYLQREMLEAPWLKTTAEWTQLLGVHPRTIVNWRHEVYREFAKKIPPLDSTRSPSQLVKYIKSLKPGIINAIYTKLPMLSQEKKDAVVISILYIDKSLGERHLPHNPEIKKAYAQSSSCFLKALEPLKVDEEPLGEAPDLKEKQKRKRSSSDLQSMVLTDLSSVWDCCEKISTQHSPKAEEAGLLALEILKKLLKDAVFSRRKVKKQRLKDPDALREKALETPEKMRIGDWAEFLGCGEKLVGTWRTKVYHALADRLPPLDSITSSSDLVEYMKGLEISPISRMEKKISGLCPNNKKDKMILYMLYLDKALGNNYLPYGRPNREAYDRCHPYLQKALGLRKENSSSVSGPLPERAAWRSLGPSEPSQASYPTICGKEPATHYRSGESFSFLGGVLQALPPAIGKEQHLLSPQKDGKSEKEESSSILAESFGHVLMDREEFDSPILNENWLDESWDSIFPDISAEIFPAIDNQNDSLLQGHGFESVCPEEKAVESQDFDFVSLVNEDGLSAGCPFKELETFFCSSAKEREKLLNCTHIITYRQRSEVVRFFKTNKSSLSSELISRPKDFLMQLDREIESLNTSFLRRKIREAYQDRVPFLILEKYEDAMILVMLAEEVCTKKSASDCLCESCMKQRFFSTLT